MVMLDRENFQLRWLDFGEAELDEKSWSVRIREFSDDLNVVGFDATA